MKTKKNFVSIAQITYYCAYQVKLRLPHVEIYGMKTALYGKITVKIWITITIDQECDYLVSRIFQRYDTRQSQKGRALVGPETIDNRINMLYIQKRKYPSMLPHSFLTTVGDDYADIRRNGDLTKNNTNNFRISYPITQRTFFFSCFFVSFLFLFSRITSTLTE